MLQHTHTHSNTHTLQKCIEDKLPQGGKVLSLSSHLSRFNVYLSQLSLTHLQLPASGSVAFCGVELSTSATEYFPLDEAFTKFGKSTSKKVKSLKTNLKENRGPTLRECKRIHISRMPLLRYLATKAEEQQSFWAKRSLGHLLPTSIFEHFFPLDLVSASAQTHTPDSIHLRCGFVSDSAILGAALDF